MLPLVITEITAFDNKFHYYIMDDITLISLVESCPHIYDRCDQNYKNMEEKRNTWEKIASTVGMTGRFTNTLWMHLFLVMEIQILNRKHIFHCKTSYGIIYFE